RGRAHHVAERALVDADADALAGARDHLDEQPQLGRDLAVLALLFDQVLGEADSSGHVRQAQESERARCTISRTSLDRSVLAATRISASRAAPRYGSARRLQRSITRAMRAASCGFIASSSSTRSAQKT